MKKKVFISLFITLIIACVWITTSYALTGMLTVKPNVNNYEKGNAVVDENETFSVSFIPFNINGTINGINKIEGSLRFDSTVLNVVSEDDIEAVNGWTLTEYDSETRRIVVERDDYYLDGSILIAFNVSFTSKEGTIGKTTEVGFYDVVYSNEDESCDLPGALCHVKVNKFNKDGIENVNLSANAKYKDFFGGTAELVVEADEDLGNLKGIQGDISVLGLDENDNTVAEGIIYSITSETNGWSVTEYNNIYSSTLSFLVEPNDMNNQYNSQEINIKIKYMLYNLDCVPCISVASDTLKTTYNDNEVYYPLERDLVADSPIVNGNPVSVNPEAGADRIVKVDGKNIYARLDTDPDTGFVPLMELIHVLKFDDTWNTVTVQTDSVENGRLSITKEALENGDYDSSLVLGNIYHLSINCDYGLCEYNVYEMGNTYIDDVYVGGTININDVIWLRRAAVGQTEALEDLNFHVQASDVNFSNEELGTVGDIGDIIAIRRRILENGWPSGGTTPVPDPEPYPIPTSLNGTYNEVQGLSYYTFNEDGTVTRGSIELGGVSNIVYDGTYEIQDDGNIVVTLTSSTTTYFSGDDPETVAVDEVIDFTYIDLVTIRTYVSIDGGNTLEIKTYTINNPEIDPNLAEIVLNKRYENLSEQEYYAFNEDGTVTSGSTRDGSTTVMSGTYSTVAERTVRVNLTTVSYIDPSTGELVEAPYDYTWNTLTFIIVDDNTIRSSNYLVNYVSE